MSNDCHNCYYHQEDDTGFKSCSKSYANRRLPNKLDCYDWQPNRHCNDCRYIHPNVDACNYSEGHDGKYRLLKHKQASHSCHAWESKPTNTCKTCGYNEDNYCCINPKDRINVDEYLMDKEDCDGWIPKEPNQSNQPINKNLLKEVRELFK